MTVEDAVDPRVSASIDPKILATLKARAALAGVVLHALEDDHGLLLFVATKWSLTKQMQSVAEVEDFLHRIGAPA